jgi:tetratricopeptide (TPR) repeat protein
MRNGSLRSIFAIVIALLIMVVCSGCLTRKLTRGHYLSYYEGGVAAIDAGDYKAAQKRFGRAYWYAQGGKLGAAAEAGALYNYALAVGQLGDFPQAEDCLKRTIALDEKADGKGGPRASMRLFELARLYQAWSKYELSRDAYEEAIPLAERYGVEKDDPINFATVLNDFAAILTKCGQESLAEAAKARAQMIRDSNPGATAKVKLQYYPEKH